MFDASGATLDTMFFQKTLEISSCLLFLMLEMAREQRSSDMDLTEPWVGQEARGLSQVSAVLYRNSRSERELSWKKSKLVSLPKD